MANHVEKHLGNSDTEDSRTNKKCLCFDVCALCLSSTMESSRLYMWRNLVESRWYPTTSSAQIFHLWTIAFASSNDHLSKLKLPAHNIKNNIYRGIDLDMWCKSRPSSPIRIVCPCTDATWPNDVCHRYLKFKSVWPCSMCIHYNMLVSKPHRTDLRYIHACMGFKHHDLLFKYLNSTLHWLWPHLFF